MSNLRASGINSGNNNNTNTNAGDTTTTTVGEASSAKRTRRKEPIEMILSKPNMVIQQSLVQLRYAVLTAEVPIRDSYRPYLWSVLLRVPPMKSSSFAKLVRKGPSKVYVKIRQDTFRTLATDTIFKRKVSEEALIRVLNTYSIKKEIEFEEQGGQDSYVQGMNVLAAPFLYVCKSETEAFALFETLLRRDCPLYVRPTMEGVHAGLMLLDKCLEIIDPKLYLFLSGKLLKAQLYGFASVLTLSACTPPLSEVLQLWDFMFAYGIHMNILFIIAQLNLIRNELMEAKSPISLLRSFPPLKAKEIIKLSVSFVARLPDDLYDLLCRHAWDEKVYQQLKFSGSS
ncbi:TBC-domain-containing protein [Nadsonia fulvescens var. elongata DSM 6958]|uniref:TBC-domain-containing protein n=1 Tax=Nadsonia fulvescens var. elongata DSM 6958 TaxID=857566 RepID=A0A1E3PEN2_9ASCO|nr:TBC-domain-containing protein [Nadsonia fulvescens var. elongata DSM 6958]